MELRLLLLLPAISFGYQESKCNNAFGYCRSTSSGCSGAFRSGLCPTQPGYVKCCIPRQESACRSSGGRCQFNSNPCNGRFASGLCPTQPSSVLCCVGGTASSGSGSSSGSCGRAAQSLACSILSHRNAYLLPTQVNGRRDGADAKSNIRDTCNGGRAKLSSYGRAPGGSVCLQASMLRLLKSVLDSSSAKVQVNSIAGGSHSRRSTHYKGRAFDLQARYKPRAQWRGYVSVCTAGGGTSFNPDNDPRGHGGHVHCNS